MVFEIISQLATSEFVNTYWVFALSLLIGPKVALESGIFQQLSGLISGILKIFIQEQRPFYTSEKLPSKLASGFGMPSGHSTRVTAFITYALYASQKINIVIVLVGLTVITAVSLSRTAMGVHSVAQVVAGFLLALALMPVFIFLRQQYVSFAQSRSLRTVLIMTLVGVACLHVITNAVVEVMATHSSLDPSISDRYNMIAAELGSEKQFAVESLFLRLPLSWSFQLAGLCIAYASLLKNNTKTQHLSRFYVVLSLLFIFTASLMGQLHEFILYAVSLIMPSVLFVFLPRKIQYIT